MVRRAVWQRRERVRAGDVGLDVDLPPDASPATLGRLSVGLDVGAGGGGDGPVGGFRLDAAGSASRNVASRTKRGRETSGSETGTALSERNGRSDRTVQRHGTRRVPYCASVTYNTRSRIDDFIGATASGQASEKRRRLDELTSVLQRGDRLVVSEFSRLGRSLGQIVTILDALAKAGVAFVALKENILVEGKRDIQTKVMTTLFAAFAEVERDLISERTREGLAPAKSSGRKLGRPKGSLGVSRLDGKEDEIRRFLELGVSKTAIAKLTGVSRTALYSFMNTRGIRPG